MLPAFILVTELTADHPDWPAALAQAEALAEPLASQLGFAPRIRLAGLPPAGDLLRAPDAGNRAAFRPGNGSGP